MYLCNWISFYLLEYKLNDLILNKMLLKSSLDSLISLLWQFERMMSVRVGSQRMVDLERQD